MRWGAGWRTRGFNGLGAVMTNEHDEDAAFTKAVALWDRRLAEAGDALDAAKPSPKVWDRISARIDQLDAERPNLTVPAGDGVWEFSSPGVLRKLLHVDAAAGWQAFLVKVEPGGRVPPHAHALLEECLVLEGEFEIEGETIRKGDLHLAFAGRDHSEIVSRTGALLYIRSALES
jgi:anti-sigma factor ChrR (cupin superfamily)